jgi:hypothetical protein
MGHRGGIVVELRNCLPAKIEIVATKQAGTHDPCHHGTQQPGQGAS